jgi:hypothetical protein
MVFRKQVIAGIALAWAPIAEVANVPPAHCPLLRASDEI